MTYMIYKIDHYNKKQTLIYMNPNKNISNNLYHTLRCSNQSPDIDYRIRKGRHEDVQDIF